MPVDPWGGWNQGFNQLMNVLAMKRQEKRDEGTNALAMERLKMEKEQFGMQKEQATRGKQAEMMKDAVVLTQDMAGDGSPEDMAKFQARRAMFVQKWGESPNIPKDYDPQYIKGLKNYGKDPNKAYHSIGAGGLLKEATGEVIPPAARPATELKGKDKIINDLLASGRLTDQEKKMIAGAVKTDPVVIDMRQNALDLRERELASKSKTLDQRVVGELSTELGRSPTDAEILDRMGQRQGQFAGTKAEATKEIYKSEVQKIGDAIIQGKQPPTLSGFGMSKITPQIRSYLADQGYDLKTAELDYNGTKRYINTLNSNQQVRLKQAINFTYHSLDIIDDLSNQWKGGRFPLLNKANLKIAINGGYGQDAQIIATKLDTQIGDLISELATVYKGGYASTDDSLKLAAKNLQSEWSQAQLEANVGLVRQNLQIRQNSINSVGVATFGGNAPELKSGSTGGEQKAKPLDPNTAKKILEEAGGDKDKAREIARERGYKF